MAETAIPISLGPFVKVLAAKLKKKNVDLPFKEQRRWHQLFYELKKDKTEVGRPDFIDRLVFDWDGPTPRCTDLSDFLNAMHFTANVSGHNPSFEVITIGDETAERWNREVDGIDNDQESFLSYAEEKAAKHFS